MARQLTVEQVEAKRAREQAVVGEMIALYCCGNHGIDTLGAKLRA